MEPVRLWAAVEFTAQSGSTDALLGYAAQAGLHLTRIVPLPGGFRARCAAWHYRPLAALARQGHVRLRVEKRLGLFFSAASTAAPHRAVGRAGAVYSAAAVEPAVRLGRGHQHPHPRTGRPGLCRTAAGRPCPGGFRHRSQAHRRGVCPAGKRRVFLGQSQFCQRAAGSPRRRCSAQARHCGRDPARPARPVRRCGHQDQPDQRHDAGGARAGRGGWTGADRHGAAGAGRCTDLCPGSGHRAGPTGVE